MPIYGHWQIHAIARRSNLLPIANVTELNFQISSYFAKEAKRLAKKYVSFKDDLKDFKKSLQKDPNQGIIVGPNLRKIRMAIKSKGKGKGGGARVITYEVLAKESHRGDIYLLLLYDKEEASNFKDNVIRDILKEFPELQ